MTDTGQKSRKGEEEEEDNLKNPHLRLSRTSKQSTMVDGWKVGTALGGEASAYT